MNERRTKNISIDHAERRKLVVANGNRYVTTKILISILLFIVFAATGLIVADTRTGVSTAVSKIEVLQKEKVDKEQYYRDLGEIKESLKYIAEKLDKLKR